MSATSETSVKTRNTQNTNSEWNNSYSLKEVNVKRYTHIQKKKYLGDLL